VRECHGDLHLGNICLVEGKPRLFDALEFDRRFSSIDVLYDLAFLLMDLRRRGFGHLANAVFNRYLDRRDEADGLAALPLFISLRAAIRAHIAASAARRQPTREARTHLACGAKDLLRLALAALKPAGARVIAIGGFSGTGKTTLACDLAASLSPAPGGRVLRSDVLRKALHHMAPEQTLPAQAYSGAAHRATYERLMAEAAGALEAGCPVVLDAVFAEPRDRASAEALARDQGVPFTGIWLEAPTALLEQRIRARRGDASDATIAVLREQARRGAGEVRWLKLDASRDAEACHAAALEMTRLPQHLEQPIRTGPHTTAERCRTQPGRVPAEP
jgi:predicted kinase